MHELRLRAVIRAAREMDNTMSATPKYHTYNFETKTTKEYGWSIYLTNTIYTLSIQRRWTPYGVYQKPYFLTFDHYCSDMIMCQESYSTLDELIAAFEKGVTFTHPWCDDTFKGQQLLDMAIGGRHNDDVAFTTFVYVPVVNKAKRMPPGIKLGYQGDITHIIASDRDIFRALDDGKLVYKRAYVPVVHKDNDIIECYEDLAKIPC